jgi:hypothetical protein
MQQGRAGAMSATLQQGRAGAMIVAVQPGRADAMSQSRADAHFDTAAIDDFESARPVSLSTSMKYPAEGVLVRHSTAPSQPPWLQTPGQSAGSQ